MVMMFLYKREVSFMNIQKIIVFGSGIIVLLLVFFMSRARNNMNLEKSLTNFSEVIENEKFDDLKLTIYFMSPFTLTRKAVSESDLIESLYEYKVIISGEQLKEQSALLMQLSNLNLVPSKSKSGVNVRMLYVFETKGGEELLKVSMWGADNSMFVNDKEVEENVLFYDIIIPFISEDVENLIKKYIGRA